MESGLRGRPAVHRLAQCLGIGLAVFAAVSSPMIEGAISAGHNLVLVAAAVLGLGTTIALGMAPRFAPRIQSIALALVVLGLSLTVFDLAGRLFLPDILALRPDNLFIQRWPPYPIIYRLTPNTVYDHTVYGDLAQFTGKPADRQTRDVRFLTDSYGFRNTPPVPSRIDLVLLGDSFAMGSGTSQDQTLAADLGRSGLAVYNMGVGGASPWQEYVNFAVELGRLHLRPGSTVVWLLYPGNDLEDVYGPDDLSQIAWRNVFGQAQIAYDTFRNMSPFGQLTEKLNAGSSAAMVRTELFINGRNMLFYKPQARTAALSLDDVRHHGNFPRLVDTITAAAALTRSQGLNLAVVVAPTKDEVYAWVYHHDLPWTSSMLPSGFSQAVAEVSHRLGLCFVDLKPPLVEASRTVYQQTGDTLYWYDDSHWNATGQAVAARFLQTKLCLAPGESFCCQ